MEKQELISKAKSTAMNIANNPLCSEFYRKCIVRKVSALNFDVTAETVKRTLDDILFIGKKIKEGDYVEVS